MTFCVFEKNLLDKDSKLAARVPVRVGLKAGPAASAPAPASDAFARVEQQAQEWTKGQALRQSFRPLWTRTSGFTSCATCLSNEQRKMAELDQAFASLNRQLRVAHLAMMAIRNKYETPTRAG